jgi:hypothetical protein
MAISKATFSSDSLEEIYCPFSGQRVVDKDSGDISELPTLLFVHYGMAAMYAYVSSEFAAIVREAGAEVEDGHPVDSPEELAAKLTLPNAFFLVHDNGWNGINVYGFVVPFE